MGGCRWPWLLGERNGGLVGDGGDLGSRGCFTLTTLVGGRRFGHSDEQCSMTVPKDGSMSRHSFCHVWVLPCLGPAMRQVDVQ